jgi:hypothetical protein
MAIEAINSRADPRGEGPFVQPQAADAERIVDVLARAGAKAIQGDRETIHSEFRHDMHLGMACLCRPTLSVYGSLVPEPGVQARHGR